MTLSATIRTSRPDDRHELMSLDLKCYEFPWSLEVWEEFMESLKGEHNKMPVARILVISHQRKIIGFSAWDMSEDLGEGLTYANLKTLCILPAYRRQGYGSKLMVSTVEHARKMEADTIAILVPEYQCNPSDPEDVSAFLNDNGFNTTGAIQYNHFAVYGREYDGYHWAKEII